MRAGLYLKQNVIKKQAKTARKFRLFSKMNAGLKIKAMHAI